MTDQLIGVVPATISAPREYIQPSEIFEAGSQVSLDWQGMAGSATFWEMGAVIAGAERNRAQELIGLMASTGEQLAVALGAHNEVEGWRAFRLKNEPDPAHEMSMRGLLETQAYFVLGASHALVNTTLRALAFSPQIRTRLNRGYAPFSVEREDWASITPERSEKLSNLADEDGRPEVKELVQPATRLGSSHAIAQLLAFRATSFHQWRPQSHGIQGVPRTSLWERRDNSLSISIGHSGTSRGRESAEAEAGLVDAAMVKLIDEMGTFKTSMPSLIGAIGGPRFR